MASKTNMTVIGLDEALKQMEAIGPRHTATSKQRAIDRAVKGVRTDAAKIIRARYKIKQKDIYKNFRTILASRQKAYGNASFGHGRGFGLVKFAPRPKSPPDWFGVDVDERRPPEGVSVDIQSRVTKPGTFIAQMSNNHVGVFVRNKNKKMRRKGVTPRIYNRRGGFVKSNSATQQMIVEKFGPTAQQILQRKEYTEAIQVGMEKRYFKTFTQQLKFRSDKL